MKNLCTNVFKRQQYPFFKYQVPLKLDEGVEAMVGWGCACITHLFWTHPLGPTAPLRLHGWNLTPLMGGWGCEWWGKTQRDPVPHGISTMEYPFCYWNITEEWTPKAAMVLNTNIALGVRALDSKLWSLSYLRPFTNTYAGQLPWLENRDYALT